MSVATTNETDAGPVTGLPATAEPRSADEWAAFLAVAPVGADTAGLLVRLAAEELSPAGRIDALRALERHVEWIQARQVRILAALDADPVPFAPGHADPAADLATTQDQVACALRLSATTAAARLDDAHRLATVFGRTLTLLEQGRIHYQQARAICDITATCTEVTARHVETLVLPRMPDQTVATTRKALHRAVLKADPDGAADRHQRARQDRRVSLTPAEDGMAWWHAYLPAEDATRLTTAVDTHAQTIKGGEDDKRTLDQRRADALIDLITNPRVPPSRTPPTGRSAPHIHVTIPYDTLIGASDDPADLKGYGPITAGQARALATQPGSVWRRLLIEPSTGLLIKTDPTTYRPTAEAERHVIARDTRCQFPTCSMPAHRCDIDHIQPYHHHNPQAGGPTHPDNLLTLCRRHHRIKHQTGWSVQRDTTTSHLTWTTPTGHRYTSRPHSYSE